MSEVVGKKISDFDLLATLANEDYFQIIDASEPDETIKNKRVTMSGLKNYVDGAGLTNRINVTQASDFLPEIDSTKEYFLDGKIDMTGVTLIVPEGGINLKGYDTNLSGLFSTNNNHTLFISPVGGSGDVLMQNMLISVQGTDSKVYDLVSKDGFQAFEVSILNYIECSSLGEINGYRQGLEVNTARFLGTPDLTLSGEWIGGYFIDTSIVRSLTNGNYHLFQAGAGFSMGSRFRSNQNIDFPTDVGLCDFAPSNFVNPSTVQLTECIISRNGLFDADDAVTVPNLSAGDLVCAWKDNQGIRNTFVGGSLEVTTEVETAIGVIDTWYPLEGVYTASNLQHFDSPVNGQLRHLGVTPIEYRIAGDFTVDGSSGDEIEIRLMRFDASEGTSDPVGIKKRVVNNFQGGRDVAFFTYIGFFGLNKDDYVYLEVRNTTAVNNITLELNSFFNIETRG